MIDLLVRIVGSIAMLVLGIIVLAECAANAVGK